MEKTSELETIRRRYGWRIVLALFICTFALFGPSVYSFIIFTEPLAREFHWSAAATGSLVSAMWLVAPLALLSGQINRRFHPWLLVLTGVSVQAVALVLLTFTDAFWQLYLLRIFMGVGKVMVVVGAPMIVTQWFSMRFATAMAIVWAGGSAGGLLMSPLTEALIGAFEWRGASLAVSAGIVIALIFAFLLSRAAASPADLAHTGGSVTAEHPEEEEAPVASWRSVRGTISPGYAIPMFLAIVGTGMVVIAGLSQQPAFLKASGLSAEAAALILGITATGSCIGAATIGWLLDRCTGWISALVVSVAMFGGLLTLHLLLADANFAIAVSGGFMLGYGIGAAEILWMTYVKRQFGEAAFPFTYGGWSFSLQIGYAVGGGISGWGLETFGQNGLLILIALFYLPGTIAGLALPAARWSLAKAGGSNKAVAV